MKEYNKNKNKINNKQYKSGKKNTNMVSKVNEINYVTFGEEIEIIKQVILENINECEAKKERDILILIDFNLYNKQEDNTYNKTYKIDEFINQTIIILVDYLSTYDRFSALIYTTVHHIICSLMTVNEIDINSFSKDLIHYKNITFKEKNEIEEYDINLNDFKAKDIEFNIGDDNNICESFQEESIDISDKEEENNYNKINGLIKAINYLIKYHKMKEGIKSDKYIILFSEMVNNKYIGDEFMKIIIENLSEDKESIFLLVGKIREINLKKEKDINYKKFKELILSKFGEKSDIIYFENMKKIKNILYNNKVIKEEIIYPNEIYK